MLKAETRWKVLGQGMGERKKRLGKAWVVYTYRRFLHRKRGQRQREHGSATETLLWVRLGRKEAG